MMYDVVMLYVLCSDIKQYGSSEWLAGLELAEANT